ncbi:uncharacterized protein LOC134686776 [Mytilus trossulus]|uniref:uncharacterized protein LOC134686776 n=1 Tax=Mytilus trossulus TaxID=6551 RepID=UPI00300583EE
MASSLNRCEIYDDQIINSSEVSCSEVDQGLCGDGKEPHNISKGTENYITSSIWENKLPTEVHQISKVCLKHNETYELFCIKHDCPCCKKCVKSHNDCKGLTDINEIIKHVKTSNAISEIEQTLQEVVENIKRISCNREDNSVYLQNKKREIEKEIKQTRTKINLHLDKLQEVLTKELMSTEQKESSKIRQLLTTLTKKEQEMSKYQTNFAHIKQYGSELQTFLSMKQLEKDIAVEEEFIQSLTKDSITNQVNISFRINKSLLEITTSLQRFGDIIVSSDNCNVLIKKRKDRKAQIMVVPLPTRHIDNLTLTLQKRISTNMANVKGCSMLPGGRMVFSCYSKSKIGVFKSDGSVDFEINNVGDTFDVVFIGDDSIAVTSGESFNINIIDLNKQQLTKTIKVKSNNDGVAYKDGHLIYCSRKKGLKMISLSDESVTNVTKKTIPWQAHVTTFGDKLFYTNDIKHRVTCCDFHGNILWKFCDTRVLREPCGISVDNDGNVFVAGYRSGNVVVISPDGQHHRQLISHDDQLKYPQGLHYDTSSNTLLVANYQYNAVVYNVK